MLMMRGAIGPKWLLYAKRLRLHTIVSLSAPHGSRDGFLHTKGKYVSNSAVNHKKAEARQSSLGRRGLPGTEPRDP